MTLGSLSSRRTADWPGYNLLAGGGMGMSHGNAQTFPRLADVIGFRARRSTSEAVAKAVITIHRDFGDRTNRKHARLEIRPGRNAGVEWFREEAGAAGRAQAGAGAPVPVYPARRSARLAPADERQLFPRAVRRERPDPGCEGYQLKTGLRRVDRAVPAGSAADRLAESAAGGHSARSSEPSSNSF